MRLSARTSGQYAFARSSSAFAKRFIPSLSPLSRAITKRAWSRQDAKCICSARNMFSSLSDATPSIRRHPSAKPSATFPMSSAYVSRG